MSPTERTNAEKVARAVELRLKQLTANLGFHHDGIIVERERDPTNVHRDRINEYRALAAPALVIIKGSNRDRERDPKASLGGNKRYRKTFELWCIQTLTHQQQEDGLSVDDIRERLFKDVVRTFHQFNTDTQATHAALVAAGHTMMGTRLSCIGLDVDTVLVGGTEIQGDRADTKQILICSYLEDISATNP